MSTADPGPPDAPHDRLARPPDDPVTVGPSPEYLAAREREAILAEYEATMPSYDEMTRFIESHPPPQSWFDEDQDDLAAAPAPAHPRSPSPTRRPLPKGPTMTYDDLFTAEDAAAAAVSADQAAAAAVDAQYAAAKAALDTQYATDKQAAGDKLTADQAAAATAEAAVVAAVTSAGVVVHDNGDGTYRVVEGNNNGGTVEKLGKSSKSEVA